MRFRLKVTKAKAQSVPLLRKAVLSFEFVTPLRHDPPLNLLLGPI
ncbi:hypothetical protein ACYDDK_000361 [Campylobacter upsaliensis]